MNNCVFFLCLVNLASANIVWLKTPDACSSMSPEVYCKSTNGIGKCLQHKGTTFCKNYLGLPVCDRGPIAYCTINGAAEKCDKVELCKTWPDDRVVAIKTDTLQELRRMLLRYGTTPG